MSIKRLIILICISSSFLLAEKNDDELWSAVDVGKSINNFDLNFSYQHRYKDDYEELKKTLAEISVSYKLFQNSKLSASYRHIQYEDEFKSRFGFGNKFNLKFDKFNVGLKNKLQKDYINNKTPEELVFRNKFSIKYDFLPFFEPYISHEFFHNFTDKKLNFEKYRTSFGIEYDNSKIFSLKLYYTYNGELDEDEFEIKNIIGMKYEISL